MKKLAFLISTLFVVALVGTGCNRDEPTPEPTPTSDTYTVVYKASNKLMFVTSTLSPCFKMNVTYTDANGQQVAENNVTLPWTKTVEIKRPFHAKFTGQLTYNEEELPETVTYGLPHGMALYTNGYGKDSLTGSLKSASRENFLKLASEHPDRLQFTQEADF